MKRELQLQHCMKKNISVSNPWIFHSYPVESFQLHATTALL